MTFLVIGCSDNKMRQRVAAMDTETLEHLSTQYPENSKAAAAIAEELSRRPRKPTPTAPKPEPAVVREKPTLAPTTVAPQKPNIEPYAYRVMEKQDTSYGGTKRMVYRLYLNTQVAPDQDRMKATAEQVWRDGNRRWNEFTVFMIFGQIKDFNAGAYGIAEFTPSGLIDFQINSVPLQMLDLEPQPQPQMAPQSRQTQPSAKTDWIDPQKLRTGEAFFVSKDTPLMPELEPANPLVAMQHMKQIPKGGAFEISEIGKKGTSPWYHVVAIDQSRTRIGEGWINSTALLGQDLKPYK